MIIRFYATLREIVGARTIDFPCPEGLPASELFEQIMTRYPALRKELLDSTGRLYGHVHFFVNGRDVQFIEGAWDARLNAEDEITIFPAVGGG